MTKSEFSASLIWMLAIAFGMGTYMFRISFIQLQAWIDQLPPLLETALTLIPPAILAALIFPELFVIEEGVIGMFVSARVLAGGLAFVIAWRTGSMIATIGIGMTMLWTTQLVVG